MMGLLSLARQEGDSAVARSFAHAAGVAMLFLLFIQSNESLMKLYSLSSVGGNPGLMTRMNTYRYDYRGAAQYVKTTSNQVTSSSSVSRIYSNITPACPMITISIPS